VEPIFFTVNLLDRKSDLLIHHINELHEAIRQVRISRPFRIDTWVILPDHMHCIWTLPNGDDNYSSRWKAIKIRFAKQIPKAGNRLNVRLRKGERGIWQRRFWEHTIRDERDYAMHVDYIHINPLKHGLVKNVLDWPHSTFHRYVELGVYPDDWAGDVELVLDAGEPRDES
jgi:putative transposase